MNSQMMKQQSMLDLNMSSRNWLNCRSMALSLNRRVHGFTFALRILLLCSISMLWSMMSSIWSIEFCFGGLLSGFLGLLYGKFKESVSSSNSPDSALCN